MQTQPLKNHITMQQIQQEVEAWTMKNFGSSSERLDLITDRIFQAHSFMGMVEELGELFEPANVEDEIDAIGDVVIYSLDFCNRMGFDILDDVNIGFGLLKHVAQDHTMNNCEHKVNLFGDLANLSHHLLKYHQQIRLEENHLPAIQEGLYNFYIDLYQYCLYIELNFENAVIQTWNKVKQRDWRKQNATS